MSLRYRSLEDMPEPMRTRVAKQPAPKAKAPRPRGPRRDEEHEQQVVFFNRITTLALNDSRYAMAVKRTFAIPNGGGRSKREAGRLKAEGVKKGVSDIFVSLPVTVVRTRGGLYIEMKSRAGSVSTEQQEWIEDSMALGYSAVVCYSADEAFSAWKGYVDLDIVPP